MFTETVVGIVYTSIMKSDIYHITGPEMVKVTKFGTSTWFVTFLSFFRTATVKINIRLWLVARHLFQERSIRIIRQYWQRLKMDECNLGYKITILDMQTHQINVFFNLQWINESHKIIMRFKVRHLEALNVTFAF